VKILKRYDARWNGNSWICTSDQFARNIEREMMRYWTGGDAPCAIVRDGVATTYNTPTSQPQEKFGFNDELDGEHLAALLNDSH